MSPHHAGGILVAFALAVTGLAGCQSTSPIGSILARHGSAGTDPKIAKAATPLVVAHGMEIDWHVKPAKESPNTICSGRSIVGPDGTLEMGPYGSCRIGGLTLPQARTALEKHLAQYIQGPAVTIAPQVPVTPPTSAPSAMPEVAWRPTRPTAVSAVSYQAPKEPTPAPANEKEKEKEIARDKGPEAIAAPRTLTSALPGTPPHAVALGAGPLPSAPNECARTLLPPYVIGPTDVLQIESLLGLKTQAVSGPHLVGPDGAVRLGAYGAVIIAGQTLDQARVSIAQAIYARLDRDTAVFENIVKGLSVDVIAYNSKVYYLITDGGGQGDQVYSLPVTGNDTVLDAFAKINGLPVIASKHKIWVARRTCPGCAETILPVDWIGITKRGEGATNWQIMPGDRVYVQADAFYAADRHLQKWLAPVERLFGATLLGSQTVNSIRQGNVGGSSTPR